MRRHGSCVVVVIVRDATDAGRVTLGIGAHGEAGCAQVEYGRVAEVFKSRISEGGEKEVLDELVAELAAETGADVFASTRMAGMRMANSRVRWSFLE